MALLGSFPFFNTNGLRNREEDSTVKDTDNSEEQSKQRNYASIKKIFTFILLVPFVYQSAKTITKLAVKVTTPVLVYVLLNPGIFAAQGLKRIGFLQNILPQSNWMSVMRNLFSSSRSRGNHSEITPTDLSDTFDQTWESLSSMYETVYADESDHQVPATIVESKNSPDDMNKLVDEFFQPDSLVKEFIEQNNSLHSAYDLQEEQNELVTVPPSGTIPSSIHNPIVRQDSFNGILFGGSHNFDLYYNRMSTEEASIASSVHTNSSIEVDLDSISVTDSLTSCNSQILENIYQEIENSKLSIKSEQSDNNDLNGSLNEAYYSTTTTSEAKPMVFNNDMAEKARRRLLMVIGHMVPPGGRAKL